MTITQVNHLYAGTLKVYINTGRAKSRDFETPVEIRAAIFLPRRAKFKVST